MRLSSRQVIAAALVGLFLASPAFLRAEGSFFNSLNLGRSLIQSVKSLEIVGVPKTDVVRDRIVVVGIDKRTQSVLGKFGPGYRPHHARLIRQMNLAGIRGAAFDIYFPEYTELAEVTGDLADAAASGAPVVMAVYAGLRSDGVFVEKPNAPVIRDNPAIGEGTINFANETIVIQGGDVEQSRDGPVLVVAESAGYRALVLELLLRTGVVQEGWVRKMGLVDRLVSSFNGKPLVLETIYPALGEIRAGDITTVNFLDVLEGRHRAELKDALVLIGVTDGVNDVFTEPDPTGAPRIEKLSGVYIHAAMLRRILTAAKNAEVSPAGPGLQHPLDTHSPIKNLAGDLAEAFAKAKEVKERRRTARVSGRSEDARVFLRSMKEMTIVLERIEKDMAQRVFSEEFDTLPASDRQVLKEYFVALYSIIPLPPEYAGLIFPTDSKAAAEEAFERYESAVDGLSNITAFSLDVSL